MLCAVHVNKFQIFINLHCLSVVCKLWVYGYVRNYNWEDETLSGGAGDHPNGGQHSLTGKGGWDTDWPWTSVQQLPVLVYASNVV